MDRPSDRTPRDILWAAVLFTMLLGATFYVGSPSFAVGVLLTLVLGPFCLIEFIWDERPSNTGLFVLMGVGLLVALSVLGVMAYPTYGNLQYLKAFAFAFFALPIIAVVGRRRRTAIDRAIVAYLIVICAIAFAQVTFIYFGVGLDPTRADAAAYVAADPFAHVGVKSLFGNPNDFATICLLLIIVILLRSSFRESVKALCTGTLALMILFAASRLCIVGLALVLAAYYLTSWQRWRYAFLGACAAAGALLLLKFHSTDFATGSYWLTKLMSISEVGLSYLSGGIGNAAARFDTDRALTYGRFVLGFGSIGFGSFQAKNYGYFLTDPLMRQDPHSLMVELGLLYGYPGFLVFCLLLWWASQSIRRSHGLRISLFVSATIFLTTFTSSSEVNFPTYWVLLFCCCALTGGATSPIRQASTEGTESTART